MKQNATENLLEKALKMSVNNPAMRILLLVVFVFGSVALESCRNPNDSFTTYEDILISFMGSDLDAQELFDNALFPTDSLLIKDEDGVYRTLLVNSTEALDYVLSFQPDTDPPVSTVFGPTFWAEVRAGARYRGRFHQTPSVFRPVLDTSWQNVLSRGALFYKLDSDGAPRKGWELVAMDFGHAFSNIEPGVVIWRNLGTLDQERLSNHSQSADLLQIESGRFSQYTYRSELEVVGSGDSIDIVSDRIYTLSAHTAQGYRELERLKLLNGKYHFGFRTPQVQVGGRFFHLITFQDGPKLDIDSNVIRVVVTETIIDINPPVTVIDTSLADSTYLDIICQLCEPGDFVLFDTFSIDTTKAPPETLFFTDSFLSIDTVQLDTTIVEVVYQKIDTFINSNDTILNYDTFPLPPVIDRYDRGEIWTYPFGVR